MRGGKVGCTHVLPCLNEAHSPKRAADAAVRCTRLLLSARPASKWAVTFRAVVSADTSAPAAIHLPRGGEVLTMTDCEILPNFTFAREGPTSQGHAARDGRASNAWFRWVYASTIAFGAAVLRFAASRRCELEVSGCPARARRVEVLSLRLDQRCRARNCAQVPDRYACSAFYS